MNRPPGVLLGIDTATNEALVALADEQGSIRAVERWVAGHLHGELLLASIVRVLARAGASLRDVRAVVVGTGPGSFTGMRVGMATAKGLAFGLGVPIVGVGTAEALARAAATPDRTADSTMVLQPAGPSARYRTIVRHSDGQWAIENGPVLENLDAPIPAPAGTPLVAVDLDAPAEALGNGRRAQAALPVALLGAGRERLAWNGPDDLAKLVPVYVTLPRGASSAGGEISWSRAHR